MTKTKDETKKNQMPSSVTCNRPNCHVYKIVEIRRGGNMQRQENAQDGEKSLPLVFSDICHSLQSGTDPFESPPPFAFWIPTECLIQM